MRARLAAATLIFFALCGCSQPSPPSPTPAGEVAQCQLEADKLYGANSPNDGDDSPNYGDNSPNYGIPAYVHTCMIARGYAETGTCVGLADWLEASCYTRQPAAR